MGASQSTRRSRAAGSLRCSSACPPDRRPQGRPLEAVALGGCLPGPLPSEGWASFLTGTGPLGRAFQGLLRANSGTWTFTPAAFQRSDVSRAWPRPRGGQQPASGGEETPQLRGAGPGPLTAGYRGPRQQHQERPAGTQRVLVTDVCAMNRPTGRALPAGSGRRGGCEAEGGTLPGSRPPTPPLALPAGPPPPHLPPSQPLLAHQPNSNSPKAASSNIPSFSSP